ncbi:endonuclease/exonuclease/phosphatase family protein [Pseudoroseicyclus tamaricis]|uniref:Endonuclease n=1 Tax=Pseudoroseicyclus tamaricis TaxID=2705421 RepID=A0A6B2K392_9RHOB|nr:endonuclease/exonuclease/phosphatase family protein [Pseudoroseicyclus tamaricis]NDV00996.1 endonuclease [Pseudoroseicyclus tamaricis]
MRIATYNVEWFDALFDDDGELRGDAEWSGRYGVRRQEQVAALGHVFRALDADAVLVIEAPDISRHRRGAAALERFAAHAGLRAREALSGFSSDTQQEIMLLHDPDVLSAVHAPSELGAPRFDGIWGIDIDLDGVPEPVHFSKPPLEAVLEGRGRRIRLIGVHAKSKAPHSAGEAAAAMRAAIESRRKQLAQCLWLRARVTAHLEAGESVIVAGDINDGPGLDTFEALFGRSGVEILLGAGGPHPLFDPHAAGLIPAATARFRLKEGGHLDALLDYILVSQDLAASGPRWRVWSPHADPALGADPVLAEALVTASDHFPVTLDL